MDAFVSPALRSTTRVVVTHALQWCERFDVCAVMSAGRIIATGPYADVKDVIASTVGYQAPPTSAEDASEPSDSLDVVAVQPAGAAAHAAPAPVPAPTPAPAAATAAAEEFEEEERFRGQVGIGVFAAYLRLLGGWKFAALFAAASVVMQGTITLSDVLLAQWLNVIDTASGLWNGWFIAYLLATLAFGASTLWRNFYFFDRATAASKRLHEQLLGALVKAPMRWFDVTPFGRIINRFSR